MNKQAQLIIIIFTFSIFQQSNQMDPFCLSFESPNKCSFCAMSFAAEGQCKKPKKEILNCLTYSSETECMMCRLGFYLTVKGKCDSIPIDNCLTMNENFECMSCNKTRLVTNGGCQFPQNRCSLENCEVCSLDQDQKEVCTFCKKGFTMYTVDGFTSCHRSSKDVPNCLKTVDDSFPNCEICRVGSFLKDSVCYKSTEYSGSIYGSAGVIKIITSLALFFLF